MEFAFTYADRIYNRLANVSPAVRLDSYKIAKEADAELAALRKDAERYRWLRETTHFEVWRVYPHKSGPLRGKWLDKEVDSASTVVVDPVGTGAALRLPNV